LILLLLLDSRERERESSFESEMRREGSEDFGLGERHGNLTVKK